MVYVTNETCLGTKVLLGISSGNQNLKLDEIKLKTDMLIPTKWLIPGCVVSAGDALRLDPFQKTTL